MGSKFELGTDGPSRILLGIDHSDTAMRAGAYAAGLARRQGAELIAVYVASTTGFAAGMAATAGAMVQTHADLASELRDMIQQAGDRLGVRGRFLVRRGNPYLELVKVAEEVRADAIVVGASKQAGHRFVGSLAGRLVRDARWPVTVVP